MDRREAHAEEEFRNRLLLLLIARPKDGWEAEFDELIRCEITKLGIPACEEQSAGGVLGASS